MAFSGSTFGRFASRYLMVFGAIFVVVGIGVVLTLGNIPYAGSAMLLMGAIFAIVGGALVVIGFVAGRRAAGTDRVLAAGIPGQATITGLTQTGMYLNEQPRIKMNLLVTLPGRAPYTVEHSEFVPLILLSRLTNGSPLAVRVDPANPQKVAVDWGSQPVGAMPTAPFIMPAGTGGPSIGGTGVDESLAQVQATLMASDAGVPAAYATPDQGNYTIDQLRAWLRANGLEAQARLDVLEDSGKIVGDERLYTMEMTLMVPGSAPEKLARSAGMVPLTAMPKVRQGMLLPVRVAAENHQLLTVEWDKV